MKISSAFAFVGEYVLPQLTRRPAWLRRSQAPQVLFDQGEFKVICQRQWPGDPQLLAQWDALYSRVPTATAFQTSDWQAPLLKRHSLAGTMRLLTVWRRDEAIGFFPLHEKRGQYETVGAMISDYLDPLIDPSMYDSAWRAVFSALRPASRQLTLHNLRTDTSCTQNLAAIAKDEGFAVEDAPGDTIARVELPDNWDDYLKKLSSRDRKECKRKLKKAESQAGAALEHLHGDDDRDAKLDDIFKWMEASGGSKGLKTRWMYRDLFGSAAAGLMHRHMLRIDTLLLNGAPGAGIISFNSPMGPLVWGAAYEQSQCGWSPGIVSFAMAIRESIARGDRMFDFLRGDQRYKYELGAVDHPLLHRLTFSPKRAA